MKRRRILPQSSDTSPAPAPHPFWFVGRFLLGLVLAQVVVAWFSPIEGWSIRSTLLSLQFFTWCLHVPGGVDGTTFHVGSSMVQIVGDCTPLMPTLVMAAAIVAYPAPRRDQLLGILAGAAVLWVFNLLRIGSLLAVLAWRPRSFDFIHMYLWQTITLAVVLLIFVVWTRLQHPRAASA